MEMTRLAKELLEGCPDEALADHKVIAKAIRAEKTWAELSAMPEVNKYPATYVLLKNAFTG